MAQPNVHPAHLAPVINAPVIDAPVIDNSVPRISPEREAREADLREVGETILNIEQAVRRADRARREIAKTGREPGFVLALDEAIRTLESARRKLQQDTYFADPQQRLI